MRSLAARRSSRGAARVRSSASHGERALIEGARSPSFAVFFLSLALGACGGGAPLLHPAHVLPPSGVTVGAGLSGQLALKPLPPQNTAASTNDGPLQELGVAPGVAPWVGGRMGLEGNNELGLTYAGRALRLDVRHAFSFGRGSLSIGLGGSAVMARRPGSGSDVSGVFGGGGDVPLLIGWRSASDIYSVWFGPRAGFEVVGGRLQIGEGGAASSLGVDARHYYGMLVAGARVGFRHVHVAIELDAAYHHVDGTFTGKGAAGTTSTNVQQITLTPAGALGVSF